MRGTGYVNALLRPFAHFLIDDGAASVVFDPKPNNFRARRTSVRAVIAEAEFVKTPDGVRAVVMVFRDGGATIADRTDRRPAAAKENSTRAGASRGCPPSVGPPEEKSRWQVRPG
jgi:hypothetical protein